MRTIVLQLRASRETAERPLAFDALISRYDPGVIDLLGRSGRVRLTSSDQKWDAVLHGKEARLERAKGNPDALIEADDRVWRDIALDPSRGLAAFRRGELMMRRNLHLGIGFLAATGGNRDRGRLRFASYRTEAGRISTVEAGEGEPLICIHGLGGSKASFLTTVVALAPERRVIAIDLPGFGDSAKPLGGSYDAPWFAGAVLGLLDRLGLERVDLIGNSMGGRVSIELGLTAPERVGKMVLLSPAMAWLRHDPRLKALLRLPLPRLGMFQPAPRTLAEPIVRRLVPNGEDGWVAAGLDEFLRAYCTTGGRFAFYQAARNIYRDEPHGERGFWRRLEELSPDALFVWGRRDMLVPIGFMKHVERALPRARHLELECGHVPQLEAPERTHREVSRFLRSSPAEGAGTRAS